MILGKIQDQPITEELARLLLLRERVYQTINELNAKFHAIDLFEASGFRPSNRKERRTRKFKRRR